MAIFLIRHGETDWNAARIVQLPDTPLSERGRGQADRVGRRMAAEGVNRILSSDYARARSTAEAVHAHTGAELSIEPLLRERHFGDHRGTAMDAIGFDIFAPDHLPPNGESWDVFRERVARAWEAVTAFAAAADDHVAVVSHGLVLRALVDRHLTMGPGVSRENVHWANTCVTVVQREPHGLVTRIACAAHLDDDAVADGGQTAGI